MTFSERIENRKKTTPFRRWTCPSLARTPTLQKHYHMTNGRRELWRTRSARSLQSAMSSSTAAPVVACGAPGNAAGSESQKPPGPPSDKVYCQEGPGALLQCKRCPICGRRTRRQSVKWMYCPSCGHQYPSCLEPQFLSCCVASILCSLRLRSVNACNSSMTAQLSRKSS